MTSAMLVSLAAQHADPGKNPQPPANTARFVVLDGSPPDSPNLGVLGRLAGVIPHPFQIAYQRDFGPYLTEIAEELVRRQADEHGEYPSIYLIIYDLARFRDLRKSDDDYGFSSKYGEDEKPAPSKQLVNILREGPVNGIHVLAWGCGEKPRCQYRALPSPAGRSRSGAAVAQRGDFARWPNGQREKRPR